MIELSKEDFMKKYGKLRVSVKRFSQKYVHLVGMNDRLYLRIDTPSEMMTVMWKYTIENLSVDNANILDDNDDVVEYYQREQLDNGN